MTSISAQGALLFSGYGVAQALSFARNALLGHTLSPRDFGIAASITLLLQLVETLSDLGHDRLIVQAKDGGSDSFVATTHSVLVARGVLLCAILYALAPWAAHFFAVPEALGAFQLVALVPLVKGFTHLDCRRAQRQLDNRPQLLVEVIPQAIALAATVPVLRLAPGFGAVVSLALIQAVASVGVARILATTPYRLAMRPDVLRRLHAFGWPILLSALPLIAVYQGDRAIIGRVVSIEALAAYSAAFMLTMVPGLLAARAGHALMLPLFSNILRQGKPLGRRFALMSEATSILAALYLTVFIIAGGTLVAMTFGSAYRDLDAVVAWLAAMWAMRMLQAVPGMALMAAGETKPFLAAGLIRAAVLPIVLYAALQGASLASMAAIGCAGEALSLLYVALRVERLEEGLGRSLMTRALFLLPAALGAELAASVAHHGLVLVTLTATSTALGVLAVGVSVMPSVRARVRRLIAPLFPAIVE
ncbi:MAG: oligosaccharide flippase family protein [Hyphomicrobium sp.]